MDTLPQWFLDMTAEHINATTALITSPILRHAIDESWLDGVPHAGLDADCLTLAEQVNQLELVGGPPLESQQVLLTGVSFSLSESIDLANRYDLRIGAIKKRGDMLVVNVIAGESLERVAKSLFYLLHATGYETH